MDVDIIINVASGLYVDVFNSYLGVLACDRIFILILSFHLVSEVDQNIIW